MTRSAHAAARGSMVHGLFRTILFVLTCSVGVAHAEPFTPSLVSLSASVLKVEALRVQGGYSLGSGVVVAPGKIVTNCHVTRDAARIHVLRGGARWPVRAQAVDIERDLCLLDAPHMQGTPVALASARTLRPGEPVLALGYTGGVGLQTSRGEVVALHRHDDGQVIQSSNWFTSGASGGGLFDADLRLVGVLTYRLRGGEAHYFAAPVDWVHALMDDPARMQPVGPLPAERLSYWQRMPDAQPRFLQAALLERARNWPALVRLATQWAQFDQHDAEPWYLRGVALARMGRAVEAQAALERAVAAEPLSSDAWYWLGLLRLQNGQVAEAHRARSWLASLKPELARQLGQWLEQI